MAERTIPRIPLATYRLQFRDGMTFDRAIGLIPHWKSLGISHLYASPVFAAVSGSTHGYDVTDPNMIEPALGGIDAFRRLSDRLLAAGLGLILDIVPNHMAASLENPHWKSALKWGRRSPSAAMFDNDWDRTLKLPVLTGPLADEIEAGHGRLVWSGAARELAFDYRGSLYPVDPATYPHAFRAGKHPQALDDLAKAASPEETGALKALLTGFFAEASGTESLISDSREILEFLDRQPWCLIHWREAAKGMSYRRFFEVAGLVGVRVEDPAVFDATHRLILDLVAEGRVQGLRIDHIDGLADPAAYLARLRQAIGPDLYLVVEKILEGDERLPAGWPVAGTTGYEFITDLAGLLSTDSPALDRAWREVAPDFGDAGQALLRAKRLMVEVNFEGEIEALVRRARDVAGRENRPDLPEATLAEAIRTLVAGFDVYRTYGTAGDLDPQDCRVLEELFGRLGEAAPRLEPALSFLKDVLFLRVGEEARDAAAGFRTRLQHLTGPVLAKALEDTFFYRYNRLIALNEVGGDPIGRAGGLSRFHRRMTERNALQPHGLSATSTHDTKRGEDARARLYAISEAPEDWIALTRRWRRDLAAHVAPMADGPAPEPSVEWLLFQAMAGALPPDFEPADAARRRALRDRFIPYVEKALREAKLRTNWSEVNEDYERAVKDYAAAAIDSEAFMTRFWRDIRPFVQTGLVNSLTQTLIKLTAPGVPDIYQGTEGSDTSLVDPDNRRMPDYGALAAPGEEPSPADFAATKAWLIRAGLGLRRRHPDIFSRGDYVPLAAEGARRDNVVAFARRHRGRSAIVVAPRLVHDAVSSGTLLSHDHWRDTAVLLPKDMRTARDAFGDGEVPHRAGRLAVADLFGPRPFALLIAGN